MVAEGMQQAGQWWHGTSLGKNLDKTAQTINRTWKNSTIGKTVAAVSVCVNIGKAVIKEKWNNSSVRKFYNKAKTTVLDFYEEHKTAINIAAGLIVIGACGLAVVATGGAAAGTYAGAAAQGAFEESLIGGLGGLTLGATGGAMEYMEEYGTLDGATEKVLERASSSFAIEAGLGAAMGAYRGGRDYKLNPGKYCFVAGTLILTTLGVMNIEDIRVGDYVYAQDVETGETSYEPVLQTYINQTKELCTVTIDGEEIQSTPGHPFYVDEEGWVSAKDLEAGDQVITADGEEGTVEDVRTEELEEPVNVYNMNVMDCHTYYVGKTGVLVHNTDGPGCIVPVNTADDAEKSVQKAVNKSGLPTKITSNLGNEIDITPSVNHTSTTKNPGLKGTPNSSIDIVDSDGNIKTRRWFDSDGM